MPVNHSLKLIFVHIPKTAGTSLELALDMLGNLKSSGLEVTRDKQVNKSILFGKGLQHLPAQKIRKRVGKKIFQEYHKISVVRNPYDRLVSYVAWLNGKWERQEELRREEFVNFVHKSTRSGIFRSRVLPMPQHNYLYIQGKLAVDEILRFENLDADFTHFKEKIEINTGLEKRMVSCHRNYKEYYTGEELEIINNFYQKDFELFGYERITRKFF